MPLLPATAVDSDLVEAARVLTKPAADDGLRVRTSFQYGRWRWMRG